MAKNQVPSYRKHRSGQARVTVAGKDRYLGPFGSAESYIKYDEIIAEYVANRSLADDSKPRTVSQVLALFWRHCKQRYGGKGKGKFGNAVCYRPAIRIVREMYGTTPLVEFGPVKLKRIIEAMHDAGQSRKYLTDNTNKIRLMFSWAASEELIDAKISLALKEVKVAPNMGKRRAKVAPVTDELVDATTPHLKSVVKAMVAFQRLTGCRPAEVCILRACDVDRSTDVWIYRPMEHKTEHFDQLRLIYVGPKAQTVLRPWLLKADGPEAWCFPSRGKRRYTSDSYRRHVQRCCEDNDLEKWSPNQLRHSCGTTVRAEFGAEHAQAILGHSNLSTTEIYAAVNQARAIEAARRLG